MESLIIGNEAEIIIKKLSNELRASTLELASKLDNLKYKHYTPWISARPVLPLCESQLWLNFHSDSDTLVVTEKKYLEHVVNLLNLDRFLIIEHLIGNESDWDIHINIESERPQMKAEIIEVINYVKSSSPYFDIVIDNVIEKIIPLKQQRARGLSSEYFRGAIFIGYKDGYSFLNLALDFVHEIGHQVLALFQSTDPIFLNDPSTQVFSYVRNCYRPAIQSLHAAAAIAFMTKFVKDIGKPNYIHPDFSDYHSKILLSAINELRSKCDFTKIGELILIDFENVAKS